jgi:hypothetical protein
MRRDAWSDMSDLSNESDPETGKHGSRQTSTSLIQAPLAAFPMVEAGLGNRRSR